MSIIAIIGSALLATQLTATALVEETMLAQGADPANVQVMEVDANHWFLNNNGPRASAVAGRTPEGDEVIVIQRNPPEARAQVIQHEVAHLLAWREYGENIRMHGPEFQRMCRKTVEFRHQKEFCR